MKKPRIMMKVLLPKKIKRLSLSGSTSEQKPFPLKFFTRRLRKNQLSLKKKIFTLMNASLEIQFILHMAHQFKKIKINVTFITAIMVSTVFNTAPSNSLDILFMLKNFKSDKILKRKLKDCTTATVRVVHQSKTILKQTLPNLALVP